MSSSDVKMPGFNPFANFKVLKKGIFHQWKAKIVTSINAARLGPFVLTTQSIPTNPAKQEEHIFKDYQALSVIQTTFNSEHFQLVATASTAQEAFLNILSHYEDSGGLFTAILI